MGLDDNINLKWIRGMSKPKRLRSLLVTENTSNTMLTGKRENFTFTLRQRLQLDTFVFLVKAYNTISLFLENIAAMWFFFIDGDKWLKG